MGIKYRINTLKTLPRRFRKAFTKGEGLEAAKRTGLWAETRAKQNLTDNESVRTGNLRNTTEAKTPIVRGFKIIIPVVAGSSTLKPDTPDPDVVPSEGYAHHVESNKPYLAPAMAASLPVLKKNLNAALNFFAKKERRI